MFLLKQKTHRMAIRYDPVLGHRFVPGLNARVPHEDSGYFVKTNSQGFRSDVEFENKPGPKPRILFFGDSFTAGDGCDNAQRFPEQVGQDLGAEVYNYGLPGSAPDQHLLILEQMAAQVQADLIVLSVQVENISRVVLSHRRSIDRTTGREVLVPRPFFNLVDDELVLQHSPVPRERPALEEAAGTSSSESRQGLIGRMVDFYKQHPSLDGVREFGRKHLDEVKASALKLSRYQPYPDYKDPSSEGARLLAAIIRRFARSAAGTPVLVVPIPEYHYFLHGLEPIYEKFFDSLADPDNGLHVAHITRPLAALPRDERKKLCFRTDAHFSAYGHRQVANLLTVVIRDQALLPEAAVHTPALPVEAVSPDADARYVLGLSCFYHNSAAAIVKDGRIVAAAEEERFTRIKNDRRFPFHAVNFCLEEAGIHPDRLSAVVYYDNAQLTFERLMHTFASQGERADDAWSRILPSWIQYKLHLPQLIRRNLGYDGTVLQEIHHRSHAAAAFFPSPFESAAILTIDGVGEWATASIGLGRGNKVELLKEMHFPHSLGLLYSAFTQFTGFKVNSGEYKMMGLAPYGEPRYVDTILDHLVDIKQDGSLELNLDYFAFLSDPTMTNELFAQLFDGPAREPESRITRREMDLARSIQQVAETVMLRMAAHARELTGESNLCIAGGVALNCVANGRILREGAFEDIWIQPAAGDSGCALGAALDVCHTWFGQERITPERGTCLQGGSYWGPAFSDPEIEAFLETHGYPYKKYSPHERNRVLAGFLKQGRVVGHFSGRTEFGPRALGSRSIMGDARNQEMQVNLNRKIKYRESFRPFAPTVLEERVADYFELDRPSPYMLLVAPVKAARCLQFERGSGEDMLEIVKQPRSDIPAITHVDYSARVQSIKRDDHAAYYDLIREFEKQTGYGVVVNTSFNVRGEPIINTPYDAYRCFMRTEMEILALGPYVLVKSEQPPWPETKGHIEKPDRIAPAGDETPLARALSRVFRADFLPVVARLKRLNALRIDTKFRQEPSLWQDCGSGDSIRDIFVFPAGLDTAVPDPERFAHGVTSRWAEGEATQHLHDIVVKLIELGLRFPADEGPEAEVPEFIYVMF